MSDFDGQGAMVTPGPQLELVSDDPRKGKCRYCSTLNTLDLLPPWTVEDLSPAEFAARFDCCDPRPCRLPPFSERSEASKARWLTALAELAADEEHVAALVARERASTASVSGPPPQRAPWQRPSNPYSGA